MIGRTQRTRVFAGLAAVGLALTSIAPSYAQSAPALSGSWASGPDGQGSSTIVGRVETPRPRQNINAAANLLVAGWAADLTATGWAGISGVEVWAGTKPGGTKLSTGMVGLARPDVGEALGATFNTSGFTAVVPASALQSLKPGAVNLYVYLLTPNKGSWYRTVAATVVITPTLAFPSDPVIAITKPQDGTAITQLQRNNKFSFSGFALDRNPITNPATQVLGPGCSACNGATAAIGTQARGAGIANIIAYIDTPPVRGDSSIFGNFGTPCGSACLYANPLVSNLGSLNVPGRPQASIITRQYGTAFDFSGWSLAINPALLAPGWHTLYVTATSSITGKQSTTSSTFNVLDFSHTRIQP